MEELFRCPFFSGDELNVVHEEHIDVSILLPERHHAVVSKGVYDVVGESFRGDVSQPHVLPVVLNHMANSLHEVGLPQANSPVEEERVVSLCRSLRHSAGRRVSELVTRTDYECLKGILGVELMVDGIKVQFPLQRFRVVTVHTLFLCTLPEYVVNLPETQF